MSSFLRNVLANFGGQASAAVLNVILVPFYIKMLGIESYGLIGFFISLQAILFIFDFGLGATTVREVAKRAHADSIEKKEITKILRTMEYTYVGVGFFVAFLLIVLSNFIASKWINAGNISVETIKLALNIFAIMMAIRWPISLYIGVLNGLELQVYNNIISFILIVIKSIGIVIILLFISNTISAFFIWQLIISFIEIFIFNIITWKNVPYKENKYKIFDKNILKSLWQFSIKVSLISIFAAIVKQLDKLLIVKIFPLEQVGYYYTAVALVSGIYLFSAPIITAVFPRFSSLYGQNNIAELTETYHSSAQLLSLLTACFSSAMIYFSYDILLIWTRSMEIAKNASPILSILSLAALFNTMMNVPHMLLLSAGILWLPLWHNIISVIFLTPTLYILLNSIGIIGGAISLLLYNLFYFIFVPMIMYKYILYNEFKKWLYKDTLQFMILGNLIFFIGFSIKYLFSLNVYISILIMTLCFLTYFLITIKNNKEEIKNLILVIK